MRLIVGLGNPDKDYENTRHNAGFFAVSWLADKWQEGANWVTSKQQAIILKSIENHTILAQPTTMMNESGRSARALMDYYKIDTSGLVIIHDDADLSLGEIKTVKATSTGAGHHGVLSVVEYVGPGFKRVRIGIGRPDQPVRDISDWVLGRLTEDERSKLENAFEANLEESIAG